MKKISRNENAEDFLDYAAIGLRIRKYRKACGLSQEQLAETVGISTTHLSHIETGNTKLSLSVFARIATALSVQADDLLTEQPPLNRSTVTKNLLPTLELCTPEELLIVSDITMSAITALRKYSR